MGFWTEMGKAITYDGDIQRAAGFSKDGLSVEEIAKKLSRSEDEIPTLLEKAKARGLMTPDPIDIYIVWNIWGNGVESSNIARTLVSIHQTEDGALDDIPASLKKNEKEHVEGAQYLHDFGSFAVEKQEVGA